jgi:predicted amidohydrolase YtcJ
MILTDGRIYPLDRAYAGATAIAIRGETIVATGSDQEIATMARPDERRIDLAGRPVIPGLVDSHIHLYGYAEARQWIDLQNVPSLEAALERVAARAATVPPGHWILGRGWNQNHWPDRAFPTAADLDAAVQDHPVLLIAHSGHAAWVNSAALQRAGIIDATPDPRGGQIVRDREGRATGILLEEAIDLVDDVIDPLSLSAAVKALSEAIPSLWEVGVTAVHAMDGWLGFRAFQALHARGELGLRILAYLPKDHLDEAIDLGLHSGDGDDWLRIGGLKLFADGALGVRTAALLEPYEGEPGNRGMLTLEPDELAELGARAMAGGLSLAIHAIGDRANRMVIDQLSRLPRPRTIPHRIEHVQLLHPDDLDRLAAHQITASMQPIHATSDMEMAERHWGERTRYAYAWRSLLERGTRLIFGSDTPVEPAAPLLGLHAAVTRRRPDGQPGPAGWHPEQRLTLPQALRAYTLGPAEAAGLGDKLGSVAPGKLADLVVLDRDLCGIDADEIPELRVMGTMIGGRWVKPLE